MSEELIEIRAVISFLWKKGYNNQSILEEITSTYGFNAMTLRGIQKRTKSLIDGNHTLFDKERTGRPLTTDLAEPISEQLNNDPYMSTRQLAKAIGVNKQTIKRVLITELNMVKINFKWTPHILTEDIRHKRIEIATGMLNILSIAPEHVLNNIYTEDETWVYFQNSHKSMWILNGAEIPTISRHVIGSKKAMIAVIWSRTGIKSITMLGQQQKFNKTFFINNVLGDLRKKYKTKGKILHMDNARPHLVNNELAKMGMKRLEHPPYSPDLAPSDFFLFGYLSIRLEGCFFKTEYELFERTTEILTSIPNYMFRDAFGDWTRRLRRVIDTNGSYIT